MKNKLKNIIGLSRFTGTHSRAILTRWLRRLGFVSLLALLPSTGHSHDASTDETKGHEPTPSDGKLNRPDERMKGFNKPAWMRRMNAFKPRGQEGKFDLVSSFTGM